MTMLFLVACADTMTTDEGVSEEPAAADALLEALPGVWMGAVEDTPLGDLSMFPMELGFTPDGRVFGRSDLDAGTTMRFVVAKTPAGASLRTVAGLGALGVQDNTAVWMSEDAGVHRFCGDDAAGCERLSLDWTVEDDVLRMDVRVWGAPHFTWEAVRALDVPVGTLREIEAGAPLPELATLTVRVQLPAPAEATADVWAIWSRAPCAQGDCVPSRVASGIVETGEDVGIIEIPDVHEGAGYLTVFLDRDRDAMQTGFAPDAGDGVALPDREVEVAGDVEVALVVVADL